MKTLASATPTTAAALHGAAPLTHLGVIRAAGADAASFLQGQLTQDVVLMAPGQTRLAAFCNAKGRMLASFWVYKRSNEELLLVCSADVLPATLKRLGMFVLRAKVRLTDATADFALHGLIGNATENIAIEIDSSRGEQGFDSKMLLALAPADGAPRLLQLTPADAPAPAAAALDPALWLWAEVRSGVARITQPVVEAFVPQMLNYESVGGVNFKKGCYPGQEVVARSQFRGAIKRRAFVAHVHGAALAGQEVFAADNADQPVGLIAQAASAPGGGTAVIVSLQLSVQESGAAVHVGAAEGPLLSGPRMPYALIEV